MNKLHYLVSLLLLTTHHVQGNYTSNSTAEQWIPGKLSCTHGFQKFNAYSQKKVYHIGVHAPSGIEKAMNKFNLTFETYLNEVVGKRFDPPIEFKMKPAEHPLQSWIDDEEDVDFMYSDTGLYSCIGTEIGGQPLGTTITSVETRGREYNLDVFGGTILARASNKKIDTVEDLKDKVIAAKAISDFAAGQSQFWLLVKNGIDYIMDPKQVIFTNSLDEIIEGVLDGRWDVGFVPSGIVERTIDRTTGEPRDLNLFKVIEPKVYVMDDGDIYPFLHSTPVFPEWPLYAKTDVDRIVSEEVAAALVNFRYHKSVGVEIHRCLEEAITEAEEEICRTMPPAYFVQNAPCDATRELAELAYQAGMVGHHSGLRPARSHFQVRTMQEEAGFIFHDDEGTLRCERDSNTYNGIRCPEGHFKVSPQRFENHCQEAGLHCSEQHICYCRPCIKAHKVDVFPGIPRGALRKDDDRCDKMSVCGTIEQGEEFTYHLYDNLERSNVTVGAVVHYGREQRSLPVDHSEAEFFEYDFTLSHNRRGVVILEVFVDGIQIPQSPFRVDIIEKECQQKFMVASDIGVCECSTEGINLFGHCISRNLFIGVVAAISAVNTEELHFSHPVEVIGQGGFGLVLLAEYRGTKVAIKRVLPLLDRTKGKRSGSALSLSRKEPDNSDEKVHDEVAPDVESGSIDAGIKTKSMSDSDNILGFIDSLSFGVRRKGLKKWIPFLHRNEATTQSLSILGTASGGSSTNRGFFAALSCCDEHTRRREEFKEEMRLLSRLRHPCITTVMGAVMNGYEPMMVMEYMENGSLHDLLRNETLYTGGEMILQIVRDVSQGLRFLHASRPPILHGDLKAKNILIDSRFRAKVGDFGLALKGKRGLAAAKKLTPNALGIRMAPEYLRRKTEYNSPCDVYSFGMILYEIYSRNTPFENENPRKVLRKVCDPRINYRPPVPSTCPKRMAEVMRKCWTSNPVIRPQAKDLDLSFSDMTASEVEPILDNENTRLRTEVAQGDMLYKVFPRKVANMLKAGQKVEPQTHEDVTIFFSDIVRFTDISRALSAVKVCNLLDRLYLAFDDLATKHGVFKVETIGDAWMGVTNLEGNQADSHAKRIAEFAMEAVEAAGKVLIDEDDPLAGNVNIRVGLHSGQVVSNVVGSLNPRYALFGDTVNTASRMESLSLSGMIQCSESAASFLRQQAPELPLRKRGKVAVKGKGSMTTFWVGKKISVDQENKRGTFDRQPVVEFQEGPPQSSVSGRRQTHRGRERLNSRVDMDGSLKRGSKSQSAEVKHSPKSIEASDSSVGRRILPTRSLSS
eukprot:scaffold2325_cov126-Cylindrotheca_fusiformis.AAC.8